MRQAKDAFNDPSASLAENNKANILQNMLKTTELHHMQNEVDARAEANTEVMRKIAMVGTVTPASVVAEAIASVTPWRETDCELNAPSRLASCIPNK
jgi:L-serine deaminase